LEVKRGDKGGRIRIGAQVSFSGQKRREPRGKDLWRIHRKKGIGFRG